MTTYHALLALLQLCSPALPVGAYTYSQGLEWAVETGQVSNESTTQTWVTDLLRFGLGRYEAPLVAKLVQAWSAQDTASIARLNSEFIVTRETAELRAETVQMGFSLMRLARELLDPRLQPVVTSEVLTVLNAPVAFPTVWSGFAACWQIEPDTALAGYLWSWCENQVMAAIKAVPLGQASGQRVLMALRELIPGVVAEARNLPEEAWSNLTPAFAIASAQHETQYSRLFRS